MSNRQPIQIFLILTPLRKEFIHPRNKSSSVISSYYMNHLVNDDLLKALFWLFGQLKIEPDASRLSVAATPFLSIFLFQILQLAVSLVFPQNEITCGLFACEALIGKGN